MRSNKIKNLYKNLSAAKFCYLVIAACLFADLVMIIYFYFSIGGKEFFMQAMAMSNQPELPPELSEQLFQVWLKSLKLFIVLYFLYHAFIYFSWYKQKGYARKYLIVYSWCVAPGCLLTGVALPFYGNIWWGLLFVLSGMGVLFSALGFPRFPLNNPVNREGQNLHLGL